MSEPQSEPQLENLNKSNHGGARAGAGRPKSEATLRSQAARDYISKQMADSLAPIVAKAITQAMEGDKYAREWLSDRAWGKPVQRNEIEDEEGNPLTILVPVPLAQAFNINAKPDTEAGGVFTE